MSNAPERMKSVGEVQQELDQAVIDLQQEAGEIELYDALGRLTEASDRRGVAFSDEQRDAVDRVLTVRGFKTIKEYWEDPEYVSAFNADPHSTDGRGIVGNILECVRDRTLIPPVGAVFAFQYRDLLIEQKNQE